MRQSDGSINYFLPDHLGSTHRIADAGGNVVRTNFYLPFGGMFFTGGAADSAWKYTGQRLDDPTGLYYYNARYYDPSIGRFITPDTSIDHPYDPQSLNRFAYVRNNPIIYTDPSGHWKFKNFAKSTLQIGGYAAMFVPGLQAYAIYINVATAMAEAALSGANGAGIFSAGVIGGISSGFGMAASGAVGAAGKSLGTGLLARGTVAALSGGAAGFVSGGMTVAMNGGSGSEIFRGAYQGAAMGAATSLGVFGISEGYSAYKTQAEAARARAAARRANIQMASAIMSPIGVDILTTPVNPDANQVQINLETDEANQQKPNVEYPGDDPAKGPEGTKWKGKDAPGGNRGNWHNPETGESWHPHLGSEDHGPHWDYDDGQGTKGRVYPDNSWEPK